MNKKSLKHFTTFLCLILIFCVIFSMSKPSVSDIIENNQEELDSFSKDLIANNTINVKTKLHGWDVSYWSDSKKVEYMIKSIPIIPSSTYEGFYYSPEDKPMGFQGVEVTFTEDGDGWRWDEEDGDNWQYTERIKENWYSFKAHF